MCTQILRARAGDQHRVEGVRQPAASEGAKGLVVAADCLWHRARRRIAFDQNRRRSRSCQESGEGEAGRSRSDDDDGQRDRCRHVTG